MELASLFDGIAGFPLAASRCGVVTAWSAEIDAQCRSVSARHFPEAVAVDDVKDCTDANGLVRPDIITAGWPCQGNSVAGKRGGMADERSGLWVEVRRVLSEFRPKWFLGENVPGLLSVNGGRDFGTVLRDLAELGYGTAYRVLDAQWFGVPQRRRRVFIVGCLGDWRRAAEVLFESEGLPWDSPPSREAWERPAGTLASRAGSGGLGTDFDCDGGIVGTLNAHSKRHGHCMASQQAAEAGHVIALEQNQRNEVRDLGNLATSVKAQPGMKNQCYVVDTMIANGDAHSGFRDHRGLVPSPPAIAQALTNRFGKGVNSNVAEPLIVGTLTSGSGGSRNDKKPMAVDQSTVRRLTPRECERLQGFPDDWTRYGADGKEMSDSARYRMLGNSVAVPCVQWIIQRLIDTVPHPSAAEAL